MRTTFTPGALFRVPAGTDDFAYGVMLAMEDVVAFYNKRTTFDDTGHASEDPMFVIFVVPANYKRGGWGAPLRILPAEALFPLPRFFWQSAVNKNECRIINTAANERRGKAATPAECVGLESDAGWEPRHIESRILDTYAGRPNAVAEVMKVNL